MSQRAVKSLARVMFFYSKVLLKINKFVVVQGAHFDAYNSNWSSISPAMSNPNDTPLIPQSCIVFQRGFKHLMDFVRIF